MPLSLLHRRMPRTAAALGAAVLALMAGRLSAAPAERLVPLPGHIPASVAAARRLDVLDPAQTVSLALTLPLRNQAGLDDLLHRLYDKADPMYGKYLTPDQFAASFGPTQADYDRVAAFAQAQGLTVTGTYSNRTVLNVSGTAAQVERAFGVGLNIYQAQADGRYFYAPSTNPVVPASLAGVIAGVIGLDNAALRRPQHHTVAPTPNPYSPAPTLDAYVLPLQIGSGPMGGLTPSDIKTAYNLNGVSLDGTGQTLGLYELDGYTASDVAAYETRYGLPSVPLENVLVDGYNGAAGANADEVTLDIELQIALAPRATKIIVYEAQNGSVGEVDAYTRIAVDNRAKEISISWGLDEAHTTSSERSSENTAFQQMAAQGQSAYASAGDSGADDNGSSLSVDDPASQPYMVGVGGTSLATNGPGGTYRSETTWNRGSASAGAGGGGISTVWQIPSYQTGVVTMASRGSTTMRNVPDVSLDADQYTGYSIYYGGGWTIYGGTSCAAPLWAAFTALVNQQRLAGNQTLIGFLNPAVYSIYGTPNYASDFHDIADGSTNLFYPAVMGYDDATGLGTFNGANLIGDLSTPPPPVLPAAPKSLKARNGNTSIGLTWTAGAGAAPSSYNLYRGTTHGGETLYQTGLSTATSGTDTAVVVGTTYYYQVTAVNGAGESPRSNETLGVAEPSRQLLTNAGFENGTARPAPWVVSAGVIDNSTYEPSHAGAWKAWLDGYGSAHTDTLTPQVTIPAAANSGTLTFFLHVDTAERSRTTVYDTLQVQVRDLSGKVLGTAATFSNLDTATGYVQKTVDLSPYLGQACQVYLVGKEDSSFQTSFVVDDFTLSVQ